MRRGWVLGLVVVAVLGGCTSSPKVTPTTPTTSATPFGLDRLKARVDAAELSATRMAKLGLPRPVYDSPIESPSVVAMCDRAISSDGAFRYGRGWTWVNKALYYSHFVLGYDAATGAQAVAEYRGRATSCRTYGFSDASGSGTIAIIGPVDLAAPVGVDEMYSFAEVATQMSPAAHKGERTYLCTAVLGKGQLMAYVRTLGPTAAVARQRLADVVPIAAEALVSAAA